MFRNLRTIRPLDAAIAVVAALVLILAVFLGWSVFRQNATVKNATPVSRAIQDLRDKVRQNPGNVQLRMDLAQAYAVAGQDKAAAEQYSAILDVAKNYVPALSGLGFIASKNQDWQRSEQYWRKVVTLLSRSTGAGMSKQYETANFYLGTALLEQKKYEDSIGYFKQALRINRSASDSHYLLAQAYKGIEATDEHRKELKYALAFDPRMPEANYEMALLLLKDGDKAQAAELLRVAANAAPDQPQPKEELKKLGSFRSHMNLAEKLAKDESKKSSKAALDEVRIAVALEPDNIKALELLVDMLGRTGDTEGQNAVYGRILEIDPNNPKALAGMKQVDNAE